MTAILTLRAVELIALYFHLMSRGEVDRAEQIYLTVFDQLRKRYWRTEFIEQLREIIREPHLIPCECTPEAAKLAAAFADRRHRFVMIDPSRPFFGGYLRWDGENLRYCDREQGLAGESALLDRTAPAMSYRFEPTSAAETRYVAEVQERQGRAWFSEDGEIVLDIPRMPRNLDKKAEVRLIEPGHDGFRRFCSATVGRTPDGHTALAFGGNELIELTASAMRHSAALVKVPLGGRGRYSEECLWCVFLLPQIEEASSVPVATSGTSAIASPFDWSDVGVDVDEGFFQSHLRDCHWLTIRERQIEDWAKMHAVWENDWLDIGYYNAQQRMFEAVEESIKELP